jgi:hypothetical protein
MKAKFLTLIGGVIVFAALRGLLIAADLPPSNDPAHTNKTAHIANTEDILGDNQPIGRFSLVPGNSLLSSRGTATTAPVMLKIDTATGRTWMLVLSENNGAAQMGFVEVPTK